MAPSLVCQYLEEKSTAAYMLQVGYQESVNLDSFLEIARSTSSVRLQKYL